MMTKKSYLFKVFFVDSKFYYFTCKNCFKITDFLVIIVQNSRFFLILLIPGFSMFFSLNYQIQGIFRFFKYSGFFQQPFFFQKLSNFFTFFVVLNLTIYLFLLQSINFGFKTFNKSYICNKLSHNTPEKLHKYWFIILIKDIFQSYRFFLFIILHIIHRKY